MFLDHLARNQENIEHWKKKKRLPWEHLTDFTGFFLRNGVHI